MIMIRNLRETSVRQLLNIIELNILKCKMSTVSSPMMNTLVAVAQMNCKAEKQDNFQVGKALIERAKLKGAAMVFLPECFDYVGDSREAAVSMAETLDGPLILKYKELATTLGVWLSLGGMHEKGPENEENRVHNSHVVINSKGDIVKTYRKAHLFDVDIKDGVTLKETDFTIPGNKIHPPLDSPIGKLGLATCYDLRFAEMSTALRQQGAQVLTYPSAFTQTTGLAHWEVLLRARAIETQCYVIAAAQTGRHHAKRTSFGHAMIVDPWGTVIAQCKEGADVAVAEIDLGYLDKVRQQMPVQAHRRHDLYGHIATTNREPAASQPIYQFSQHTIDASIIFYKTNLTIAFVNRKCVVPGHVLVCPMRVVKRFCDMTTEEVADMFTVVQRVARVIEDHHGCSSSTIGLQDGPDAGQTVQHVHIHILPRRPDDFKRNDDIYTELEKHDKDSISGSELSEDSADWRTLEDMQQEAHTLRQLFVKL